VSRIHPCIPFIYLTDTYSVVSEIAHPEPSLVDFSWQQLSLFKRLSCFSLACIITMHTIMRELSYRKRCFLSEFGCKSIFQTCDPSQALKKFKFFFQFFSFNILFVGEPSKVRFSIAPPPGDGYGQWLDGMRAVLRLPGGLPTAFRKTVSTGRNRRMEVQ
jgi:hypothetical protein